MTLFMGVKFVFASMLAMAFCMELTVSRYPKLSDGV
jgi:hypothetical protein